MLRLLFSLPFALAITHCADAEDWTRFRGENGFGISNATSVPVEFKPESIVWKVPLPGYGNSSPIVSKGLAFMQSASDDGKKRTLIAVDCAKGAIRWTKDFVGSQTKVHEKSSMASNTAAADGERVYIVIWDGAKQSIFAFDYGGKEIWKNDLGRFLSQHGAGHSPMVVDGKVVVNLDQDGQAEVVAFDAKSGDVVWRKSRHAFRACYTTPYLRKNDAGKPEIVVASTAGITAYDPASGSEIWNWEWKFSTKMPLRNVGGPIEHNGMIFAVAGDGGGDRHMVAISPGGADTAAKLVWEKKKGTPYVPMLLARDGYLFWITDKENVAVCVEAKTGNEIWKERLGGSGQVFSSPVIIDGKIYSSNENGSVFVFAAKPKFELLAKNELKEDVFASPAVADGKLYYRGGKHLFCIGTK
jgi:outer membrane protein assembly factor BamB